MKKFLIYDSGIGGKIFFKRFNNIKVKKYLFIDKENFPYGEKTKEQLEIIAIENLTKLTKNYDQIIIACNTLSILLKETNNKVLKSLIKNKIIKITDWIDFLKKEIKKIKKILVIATKFTIDSKYYVKKLKEINKNIKIYEFPKQVLVNAIEKNNKKIIYKEVKKTVNFLNNNNIDGLILGCTHFSLLKNFDFFNEGTKKIKIFDPTETLIKNLNLKLNYE